MIALTPPALAVTVRPAPEDAEAVGEDAFGCVDVAAVEALLAVVVLAVVLEPVLGLLVEDPPQPASPRSATASVAIGRHERLFMVTAPPCVVVRSTVTLAAHGASP
jgi:hypothetical protein